MALSGRIPGGLARMRRPPLLFLVVVVSLACTTEAGERDLPSSQAWKGPACELPAEWVTTIDRGTRRDNPGWDIVLVARPPNWVGDTRDAGHSGPQPRLQEIPLVLYGPGQIKALGDVSGEPTLASLAPTWAEMLDLHVHEMPEAPLKEALMPGAPRPRLLVTVVIDGGGWNVLRRWPQAWPNLARMMQGGTTYVDATVGSSPSITPSSHATIGTGLYPRAHGVTGIVVRDGEQLKGAFTPRPRMTDPFTDPTATLERPTLAELYDRAKNNEPKIALVGFGNYVLGMIGRGSAFTGADKDIAMYTEEHRWISERRFYSLPDYVARTGRYTEDDIEDVDLIDGMADGKWRGHTMEPLMATPAFSARTSRTVASIIAREEMGDDDVSDLLYVNFKPPDYAGHLWNMTNPEQRDAIASVDEGLGDLHKQLDRTVGRGRWVLAVTADHGQTPLDDDGWPISMFELRNDASEALDHLDNKTGLFDHSSQSLLWVDRKELEVNELTPEHVASFITEYTIGENPEEGSLPEEWKDRADERPFAAAFPVRRLEEVVECTGASKMPRDD